MSIRAFLAQELEVVVHMAVGDKTIRPAIVVEIRQGAAPADPGRTISRHAARGRSVLEQPDAQVSIERVRLVQEIRDQQVGQAVAVDVFGIDSHPSVGQAMPVVAAPEDSVTSSNVPSPRLRKTKFGHMSLAT